MRLAVAALALLVAAAVLAGGVALTSMESSVDALVDTHRPRPRRVDTITLTVSCWADLQRRHGELLAQLTSDLGDGNSSGTAQTLDALRGVDFAGCVR